MDAPSEQRESRTVVRRRGSGGLRSSGGWNVQGTTCLRASRAGSLVVAQVCRGLAREWPFADCFIRASQPAQSCLLRG